MRKGLIKNLDNDDLSLMSASSNITSFRCENKMEGKVLSSWPTVSMCNLPIIKEKLRIMS
jgi:hypothetical protein